MQQRLTLGGWHQPAARPASGRLRLLVTDPFHPVTAMTLQELRRGYANSVVLGVDPEAERFPAPPGYDGVIACPVPEEPGYCEAIGEIAVGHGIRAVLPWTDRDALALSRGAKRLAALGVATVCPPHELVALACDKWATIARLDRMELPVPATRVVRCGDELRAAARALGYPDRSLVVKPRSLSGGLGVWRLGAAGDVLATSPRPQVPVEAMAEILDRMPRAVDVLVQEELSGVDTSVDVLCRDGRVLAAVSRTRKSTLGGLCVAGTVGAADGALLGVIEALMRALNWSGIANVQLIVDDACAVVYEINPRAAGSIGVCAHTGLDLLSAAITLAETGAPLDLAAVRPRTVGFRRHWDDQCWPADREGAAVAHASVAQDAVAVGLGWTSLVVVDYARTASGCHKQRAADAVLRAAMADGARCIAVGSCGAYGIALALAAQGTGVDVTVTLPASARGSRERVAAAGASAHMISGSYEDAVADSRSRAAADGVVDGNVDGPYAACVEQGLASIADELIGALAALPAVVWVPLGNGTTAMALARAFARRDAPTRVVGVTARGQNSVLASWPGARHIALPRGAVRSTSIRDPLVNWAALHGQEVLDALHAGNGAIIGVEDADLVEACRVLRRYGLHASPAGVSGVAGAMVCETCLRYDGLHLAIVTGR